MDNTSEFFEQEIIRLNRELDNTNRGILALCKELDDKNEELKKNNNELEKIINDRKKIEKTKNELISVVSHELRAPLTSISGSLSIVLTKMRDKIPVDIAEIISISYNSSRRMHSLINNLLDLDKIESDKYEIDIQKNFISEIINSAISDLKSNIREKKIEIIYEENDYSVLCDWNSAFRIILNLLSNAIKFSSTNSKIEIKCEARNARCEDLLISIQDFGRGIPEDFKPKIFNKFQQAEREDATVKGGSGLGLTITKMLVEKHDGKIWFTSELKSGTTFFFTLPAENS